MSADAAANNTEGGQGQGQGQRVIEKIPDSIYRAYGDTWKCKRKNCNAQGDKWFMQKHNCKGIK